jgi:hypothetical protein
MSFPPELAKTIQEMMATMHQQQLQLIASLRAEIAELPSEQQQDSPSRTQISAQASKKLSMTPMVARLTSDQAADEDS